MYKLKVKIKAHPFSKTQDILKKMKWKNLPIGWEWTKKDLSTELVDYCKVNNINLLSYGSLAQGLLSGKYDKHFEFNEDDCRNRLPHFHGETLEKHIPLIRKIKSIALKYKVSSSQVALRWALEEPMISSVISGIKTINQLEDNYGCLDWEIDESDYDFFKRTQ